MTDSSDLPIERDYGAYAVVYDRLYGEPLAEAMMPAVEELLLRRLGEGSRILEVCCGTGHMASRLRERGFRVIGLDLSLGMLLMARKNAPQFPTFLADAARFSFKSCFDAILMLGDGVNHLLRLEEVRSAFGRMAAALRPGGVLVFDMLLDEQFPGLQSHTNVEMADDFLWVSRGRQLEEGRILEFETTLFLRRDGTRPEMWRRWDSRSRERLYDRSEIEEELRAAGFRHIRLVDAAKDLGSEGGDRRMYFQAVREEGALSQLPVETPHAR